MSIDLSGRDSTLVSRDILISVDIEHPLVRLSNALPMDQMMDRVTVDLKASTFAGQWWLGRKLIVRLHLGIFLLQKIFDLTDRAVIDRLRTDAAFQVFSGLGIVAGWRVPAFSRIEEFRNRLTPETHREFTNLLAQVAVNLGFGDCSGIDVDSTVQEANMAYSADGNLLKALGFKVGKLMKWLSGKVPLPSQEKITALLEPLGSLTKGYFFASKKDNQKRDALTALHGQVKKVIYKALEDFSDVSDSVVRQMPWNIRLHWDHVKGMGKRYVLDVAHWIRTGNMKAGKILAFHLRDVAYINKHKNGKPAQFGREFQLARIVGNFVMALPSNTIRAKDKSAMADAISTHREVFGDEKLNSVTGDRGYYSRANIKSTANVPEVHLGYQWGEKKRRTSSASETADLVSRR